MPEIKVKCPYCRREFIIHLGMAEKKLEEEEEKKEEATPPAPLPGVPKVELKPKLPTAQQG